MRARVRILIANWAAILVEEHPRSRRWGWRARALVRRQRGV